MSAHGCSGTRVAFGIRADRAAQRLAGFEVHHTFAWHFDGLARAGVTPDAWLPMVDGKTAKAANFDAVATHQCIANGVQDALDRGFGITLGELVESGGQFLNEI